MARANKLSQPHDFKGAWFHCIATTYGAWLYGDSRGFRTRHHREHVEAHAQGWVGRLWAKRGKELAIRNRRHQLNVYRYILAHNAQGA